MPAGPIFRPSKIPVATLALSIAVLGAYFFLSGGNPYISDEAFGPLAAVWGNGAFGVFTHLFLHVGPPHLFGNLLPLLLFGAIVEIAAGSRAALAVFFISGVLSGALFSFLNPGVPLAGASAAVSGLMGAALVSKPRKALVFLLATPVVLQFLVVPAVNYGSSMYSQSVSQQAVQLSQEVKTLVAQNRTAEAVVVSQKLERVEGQAQQVAQGKKREFESETTLSVHLFGAILGVLYLFLFANGALVRGKREYADLGESLYAATRKAKKALKIR
ncbi:MAG: rhomboid family intramembrane serine protease [Candidatus Micrarchaeia archaeon]|jgi:membrane associated rhomboid family serine protease